MKLTFPITCNCQSALTGIAAKHEGAGAQIMIVLPDCFQEHLVEVPRLYSWEQLEQDIARVLQMQSEGPGQNLPQ